MTKRVELPLARERYGFARTVCGCSLCQAPCRHVPGSLDAADLPRLISAGEDPFAWAERHLRAQTDKSYPVLVPARAADGSCHWFYAGRCAVHENAPYGCAFFDAHMKEAEVAKRVAATVQALREDAASGGLYYRVWQHLRRTGLVAAPGDRAALDRDRQTLLQAIGKGVGPM